MQDVQTIGRSVAIRFPDLGETETYARTDTGAKTSAVWASSVQEVGDTLEVIFFGEGHPLYTGKPVVFHDFTETVVASSNGTAERRYKVRLLVVVNGRRIRARFTLADRSTQAYPVLIGRNVLRGKFLVDVSIGVEAMRTVEQNRSVELHLMKEIDL